MVWKRCASPSRPRARATPACASTSAAWPRSAYENPPRRLDSPAFAARAAGTLRSDDRGDARARAVGIHLVHRSYARQRRHVAGEDGQAGNVCRALVGRLSRRLDDARSEEHTSELQSRFDLVCRLLLEKKKHK